MREKFEVILLNDGSRIWLYEKIMDICWTHSEGKTDVENE